MIPDEVAGSANRKALMFGAGAGLVGALVCTVAAFIPFCSCCPFGLITMGLIVVAAFAAAFTADWENVPSSESMKFGALLGARAGIIGGVLGMSLSFLGVLLANFLYMIINTLINGGGDEIVTVVITYLTSMIISSIISGVVYFVEFVIAVVLSVAAGVVAALVKGRKD